MLHILRSLKSTGKGVVVMPHGVLFRGNAEADIRRELARRGFIKGIIGLPANLFYGTGIPAYLVVLDKEAAAARTGIFMVDASQGYAKDSAKNRLRHQDIRKIVDVFNGQGALDGYSRMVPLTEIQANDYNLNISRYIDTTEPEDIQDIAADLEAERERVKQQQDELQEEHGGEEGLLAEVVNDHGNITKGAVRARIKETQLYPEAADEYARLTQMKGLPDTDTSLGRRARDAQKKLDARVERKTASLSHPEVQALVVDDKWLASLVADLQAELDTISQALTRRITELANRYAAPCRRSRPRSTP